MPVIYARIEDADDYIRTIIKIASVQQFSNVRQLITVFLYDVEGSDFLTQPELGDVVRVFKKLFQSASINYGSASPIFRGI